MPPKKAPKRTPKTTRISLTAEQLASLDLLIAKKQAHPNADLVGDDTAAHAMVVVADNTDIGPVVADGPNPTLMVAHAGDMKLSENVRESLNDFARKLPLQALLELRLRAIRKP